MPKIRTYLTRLWHVIRARNTYLEQELHAELQHMAKLSQDLQIALHQAKEATKKDVKANREFATLMSAYDRLIAEQGRRLNDIGKGEYALPPISCVRSVRPDLFNDKGEFSMPINTKDRVGSPVEFMPTKRLTGRKGKAKP